jgi:hypothetical protein
MSLVPELSAGGYLLPAALAGAAVLVPLGAGALAGYRTTGRMNERLRAGARAGILLAVIVTGLAGSHAATTLLQGSGYDASGLLSMLPTLVAVWLLAVVLYAIPVSTVGSVLGGHLRTRSRYTEA